MAKAGLPESQSPEGAADTRRKDARRRRRPLPRDSNVPAALLRGAGAMPSQGIEGDERDAYVALDTCGSVNVGSPTGRESHGDGVPVAGVTACQSGDR